MRNCSLPWARLLHRCYNFGWRLPCPMNVPPRIALEVDGRWAFWRVLKLFLKSISDEFFFVFSLAQTICSETQNSILSIQKRKSFWWVFCSLVQMFSTKTQNSILSIQNPKKSEQAHLGATQTQIWCLIMPPFGHVIDPFLPPSAHYMAKVYIPWPKFCVWASSIFTWINGLGQG